MKLTPIFFLSIILFFTTCKSEPKAPPQTLFNKDFNWTITIPKNYISLDPKEWAKKQQLGIDMIEESQGVVPDNVAKTIFVFKKGNNNSLEANYQPFDTLVDGSYLESIEYGNELVYETFTDNFPNLKVDQKVSKEIIDGLEFYTNRISVDLPSGNQFNSKTYSRLFDKEEFTVNIMYDDKKEGRIMMDAWRNSKFE